MRSQPAREFGRAHLQLSQAAKALVMMRTLTSEVTWDGGNFSPLAFQDYIAAWEHFLTHLEKAWMVIEQTGRALPRWSHWGGKIIAQRRADEVLVYLFHARNSDQHGVAMNGQGLTDFAADVTLERAPTSPLYAERGPHLSTDDRGIQHIVAGDNILLRMSTGPGLIPVTDRGNTYQPPTEHNGRHLLQRGPVAIAEIGLAFYERVLQEAEKQLG